MVLYNICREYLQNIISLPVEVEKLLNRIRGRGMLTVSAMLIVILAKTFHPMLYRVEQIENMKLIVLKEVGF